MTSVLDQYNSALAREEKSVSQKFSSNILPTSGYISIRDETPIFTKQKMKISLPQDLKYLRICNNWLVALMSHNVILRMFLVKPDQQNEVYLEKFLTGLRVSNVFLDPLGNHLLISLAPKTPGYVPELLYLHQRSNRPKKIERFRDHEITAVGFNYNNTSEISTGSILIGTSKGLIFETEFGIEGEKMVQSNWKQVFDIGRGEHCPITGIEFHKAPNTSRYFVLVSTLNRLYKFHEELRFEEKGPYLHHIFTSYLNIPEDIIDYHEIPNKLKYSKLRFHYDRTTKFPKSFGWLTDAGVYLGEIDPHLESPQFITTHEMVPFPANEISQAPHESASYTKAYKHNYPLSLVLTNYHVLLIYIDRVIAISTLNYQTIYEELYPEQIGKLIDITKDSTSGTVYVFSARNIYRYKITNEQRNVWAMYLDKNEFELAELSTTNPAQLDIVLTKKGEQYFNQKNYLRSAEIFASTQNSFEDICLRFMNINEYEALLVFLQNRLDKCKLQDKIQITMLVVWIVELYLTQMARYASNQQLQKNRQLQTHFDAFMKLPRVIECMRNNRSVIYDLMASHGDNFNLTSLTAFNRDYESVIDQYVVQGKFIDALQMLKSQNNPELFYKYSPILIEAIPHETITAIIQQNRRLDPIHLLPTFVSVDTNEHQNEVIRYLEFCIHSSGCTEQAIHNFLLRLYARQKSDKLMTYLDAQGKDISLIHYDLHYALRVCTENKLLEACVFLQCLLELWMPAVELALSIDANLAEKTASQTSDRDLQRKLWLRIAEHEIKGKNDVAHALELLNKCSLLQIEDLLPFFDDFQKIDHFKEAICEALEKYNEKIKEQRKEMKEAAKSAERVRDELQTFRNRAIIIDGQEQCSICDVFLLVKPFFMFPCGHKFHTDCLETGIAEYLSPAEKNRLKELKSQLQTINISSTVNQANESTNAMTRDQLRNEIETILANDCLYCGEYMINSIDKPFIDDWETVNMAWE